MQQNHNEIICGDMVDLVPVTRLKRQGAEIFDALCQNRDFELMQGYLYAYFGLELNAGSETETFLNDKKPSWCRAIEDHQMTAKRHLSTGFSDEPQFHKLYYCLMKNDQFLGMIDICGWGDQGVELNYWLIPAARGKGYMHQALSLLENKIFTSGALSVTLGISSHNHSSQAVAKRLGYYQTDETHWVKTVEKWQIQPTCVRLQHGRPSDVCYKKNKGNVKKGRARTED